jgi:hypothetical protein
MVNMFNRDTIESKYIETAVSRSLPEKRQLGFPTLYYAGQIFYFVAYDPDIYAAKEGDVITLEMVRETHHGNESQGWKVKLHGWPGHIANLN